MIPSAAAGLVGRVDPFVAVLRGGPAAARLDLGPRQAHQVVVVVALGLSPRAIPCARDAREWGAGVAAGSSFLPARVDALRRGFSGGGAP